MGSTLYSVALPIGNNKDISSRTKHILEKVDYVACEDTRKAYRLFKALGITKKIQCVSYYSYNEAGSSHELVKLLKMDNNIALIADAGTPRISDPGFHLLKACYQSAITIRPIPGPSALTSILSISPFLNRPLLFLGFLPVKSSRQKKELNTYQNFKGAVCLFESVHRLTKTLDNILAVWGNLNILIGRELTKNYEEIYMASVEEAIQWSSKKKGEFTILIEKIPSNHNV